MTRGVGGESPATCKRTSKVSITRQQDKLLSATRSNGAPREVMKVLQELPEEEFGGSKVS
jgi:Protein of unknown function (DUF2795)